MSNDINLESAIVTVVNKHKTMLMSQLNDIELQETLLQQNKWTPLSLFLTEEHPKFNGIKYAIGVYAIFHVTDVTELFYIGEGALCNRKNRHRSIFRNKGIPIQHYNYGKITSSSDSIVGRKMYFKDQDPTHWYFSYIECEKHWAKLLERELISQYMPPANIATNNTIT